MKEYFINTIEQLQSIENEFDCKLDLIGSSDKYTNFKQYSNKEECIDVFLMPKKEFINFADFRFSMHLIPEIIALDVMVRINDWILSGGSLEDDYVMKQINYASNFIK